MDAGDSPMNLSQLLEASEYPGPCREVWVWLSEVCGRRGPHFCWVMHRQYAGGYRWKALSESHMAHQAGEECVYSWIDGGAASPSWSPTALWCWQEMVLGTFCWPCFPHVGTRFPPDWSCNSSSPFSSQCPWTTWPHALICLGHVLAYSFGPRKRNDSALFTLNSDLFRQRVMWSP